MIRWFPILLIARSAWAQAPAPVDDPAPTPEPSAPAAAPAVDPDIAAALAEDTATRAASAPPAATSNPATGGLAGALQSFNPDLSFILDMATAWFSDEDNLQAGAHDPQKTGFNLQQLELSIGKAVDPYFRFDGNIVFSQFGVEIEEAYATTLALPHSLQLRAGQFLTRFGRINPTHPHSWDFVDQPIAIGRLFGGEGNRGLGFELSYLTPAPFFLEVVGSVTDPAGEATARSFFGGSDLPIESPRDVQATLSLKEFFELSHDWSLATGQSVATGPNGTGHDNRTDVYGVDAYLKYRPITRSSPTIVSLQTEWFLRRRQVPGRLRRDLTGYAQVLWRFAQRWAVGGRYELGTAARDAGGETGDDLDPAWTDSRHRGTFAVTFWPTEFSRIRAQGSVDAPGWRESPIWASFLALEFVVGAHGAHKF